jgi:membrane protein required for colicin V production
LGGLDRFLGALFGLLKGTVIVLVLALVAGLTALPQQPLWRESALGAPLAQAVLSLRPWLPRMLGDRLQYGTDEPGATPATGAGTGAFTGA